MCIQVYGMDEEIVPAPPVQLLRKFCPIPSNKTMGIKEYRSGSTVGSCTPPLLPFILEPEIAVDIYKKKEGGQNDEKSKYAEIISHSTRSAFNEENSPKKKSANKNASFARFYKRKEIH